jgi:hypothetical protein
VHDVKLRLGWLVIGASHSSTIGWEQLKREESMLAAMTNVDIRRDAITNIVIIVTTLLTPLRI